MNAFAERWVLSIKSECTSGLIFFSEESLRQALREYTTHYHEERNHQGNGNRLLFPPQEYDSVNKDSGIRCHSRLGGVLKYYFRKAA
ncbi:integrase core domain-containing protein [bacterium]|nr:integrase core domain-containing protein [bacterium]